MKKARHAGRYSQGAGKPDRSRDRKFSSQLFWIVPVALLVLAGIFAFFQTRLELRLDKEYMQPGIAYYNRQDYSDAEREFREYLRYGSETDAHYYLGMCLYNEGKSQEAFREFQQDTYDLAGRRSRTTHINERSMIMIKKITGAELD